MALAVLDSPSADPASSTGSSPRLAALAAVVLWGVSFVATRAVVREISPAALVFARAGLGAAFLALLMRLRGQNLLPPRGAVRSLALMGLVGIAVHLWLQAQALTLTSAVNTGWLVGLTPVWSALLSAVLLREGFGAGKCVGLATGFLGASLVVTRGRLSPELLALPATRGDLLVLASTLNWALYSVLGHPVLRRLGAMRATLGATFAGWLLLTPLLLPGAAWREYAELSLAGWGAVLFLGLGCSGLGYLFWYAALARIETSRVAAFLYLEPLVTLLTAVAWLGESVGLATVSGGCLLLFGVYLVQRAPSRGGDLR